MAQVERGESSEYDVASDAQVQLNESISQILNGIETSPDGGLLDLQDTSVYIPSFVWTYVLEPLQNEINDLYAHFRGSRHKADIRQLISDALDVSTQRFRNSVNGPTSMVEAMDIIHSFAISAIENGEVGRSMSGEVRDAAMNAISLGHSRRRPYFARRDGEIERSTVPHRSGQS